MKQEYKDKICMCECHIKGIIVMHSVDCCSHSERKYLNSDETLDENKYIKVAESNLLKVEYSIC